MRVLLIPVKDLRHAKQRLASRLAQAERTQLAEAMMRQTFDIAAKVRRIDRVAIVSLYPPALELARNYEMLVIPETSQGSESSSVDYGIAELTRMGATGVLRLPIDLPFLTPEAIERLLILDTPERPHAILTPSRDRQGTNALWRRPGNLFPSLFGPDSLRRHQQAAREREIPCLLHESPEITFDLDDPADLDDLLHDPRPTPLRPLLASLPTLLPR
jgi:2-phospho-L-lactate guanylyltransferase